MVRKVIIPAAGLGTRLFPATKEQPKEMLPIFSKTEHGDMMVKPVVQLVFEQLHDAGLREFCYVVGRGKRGIEDHFTPDAECIRMLEEMGKNGQASDLESFYKKLETSTIMWVNQPEPKGFGNAVFDGTTVCAKRKLPSSCRRQQHHYPKTWTTPKNCLSVLNG